MDQHAGDRSAGRAEVLRTLSARGPMSQADLARSTALAPSTVSGIVAALRAEGVLAPASPEPTSAPGPKGGRPGTVWALQPSVGVVAGLDFGKKHVRVAVADLAHHVLAERSAALLQDAPAAEHIARAQLLLDDALQELGLDRAAVLNVGVGIPGPLRRAGGQLADASILPGWTGLEVSRAVGAALDLPVRAANDADLGALAEWMWGSARGRSDVVYVKASTGIGAGLILGGAPYSGTGGTAGEIGHLVVDPQGAICRCGHRGCLETVAGTARLLDGLAHLDPELTVGGLIRLARAGEPEHLRALAGAGRAVGTALAALCNLINPECVVVGGDLAPAGELLLDPMTASLRQAALASAADDVTVVRGALGERAEVLGAVALALRTTTPSPPRR